MVLLDDPASILARAAEGLEVVPELTHEAEDGEGGIGFVPNPDKN